MENVEKLEKVEKVEKEENELIKVEDDISLEKNLSNHNSTKNAPIKNKYSKPFGNYRFGGKYKVTGKQYQNSRNDTFNAQLSRDGTERGLLRSTKAISGV